MKIDSIDLTPDNKEIKILAGRDKGEIGRASCRERV